MPKGIKYYQEQAKKMRKADNDRDNQWLAYEKMYHTDWELPQKIKDLGWVRKVVSTDPPDAVDAGVRVLSSLTPGIEYQPLNSNADTKEDANRIERNLKWQLMAINNIRPTKVESDVVFTALLHFAVTAYVIDLDHQIELVEKKGGDTKNLKKWRRDARFRVIVHNPRDVHVKRNGFGVQAVLLVQEREASEVINEWGSSNRKLKELAKEGKSVVYHDYTDMDDRVVWCTAKDADGEGVLAEIVRVEHELDFFPWVAMDGGTNVEKNGRHKHKALLHSYADAGHWQTQNLALSMAVSEVLSTVAQPRFMEEGPNQDSAEIDYGDPSRIGKAPVGNTVRPLPGRPMDSAAMEVNDRLSNMAQKSTVSQILQGGAFPAGTAFSTLNLATQTALGALKPSQDLAEKALAGVFRLMLLWVLHTEKPLLGYNDNRRQKDDFGAQIEIEPDMIDPEAMYINVDLKPDVPTDRLQRANAASILHQMGYPKEYALQDMGVDDPITAIKMWYMERLLQHRMDLMMETESAQAMGAIQQQQSAEQAMMQQQMEAQMMAEQMPGGMFPGGQGFNPAMGGTPSVQVMPGGAEEIMQGEDMSGNPMASLGELG